MYQPAHGRFNVEDRPALLAQISVGLPATLVTAREGRFWTSILPMIFYPDEGAAGVLRGHLARANPHWREAEPVTTSIAIFNGPDAYISPAWYEEKRLTGKVVPTWNYTTVVAHGTLTTRHEPEWLLAHVRRLVDRHEIGRPQPWSVDDAPDGYIETMARAIVGLELHVAHIEAKRKLTQNRSLADFDGAIAGLATGSPREDAVAADMRTVPNPPRSSE